MQKIKVPVRVALISLFNFISPPSYFLARISIEIQWKKIDQKKSKNQITLRHINLRHIDPILLRRKGPFSESEPGLGLQHELSHFLAPLRP